MVKVKGMVSSSILQIVGQSSFFHSVEPADPVNSDGKLQDTVSYQDSTCTILV